MDRSTLRMPDPGAPRPLRERRRTVRQRLHTPVYVSFNSPQSDVVVDLSELLDLHEYGFAVQTAIPTNLPKADRLEVNRAVTLCLDLPETRQYVHGSGQVMWTDETGRAGIRFSFLPDRSRQALKEWLFANLLVASANHATRVNQLALHRKESPAPELAAQPEPQPISANPPAQTADTSSDGVLDQADVFSALDDVRQQMRDMQSRQAESPIRDTDSDLALQFITECAAGLTGASGVALALLTGDKIICRARVGDPAPPVGSEIGAGTGLSGECLRTGAMVSCADTESDPRVDPEICRRFGIGSFMAAPIFADFRVVGLLEIFSPYPHTFAEMQEVILERLADLVPASGNEDREILEIKAAPQPVAVIMEEKAEAAIQQEQEVKPAPGIPQPHSTESGVIDHLPGPSSSQGVKPEAEEHQSDKRREHRLPDDHAIEDRVTDDRPAPARRLPLSHLVLLVLTIAVAAMALGYLFAPTIQQFLMRRAQATPSASTPPVAVDLRGHALSPPELRQLAEAGHPDAQWQLGILYHDGDVVPKDDSLAVLWFERAAQQGYVSAQSTLGAYYFAGRGVPQDLSKAFFWSQLALAGGDATSKLRLEDLSARMTKSQVASARQQAEAWLRAHNQPANTKAN